MARRLALLIRHFQAQRNSHRTRRQEHNNTSKRSKKTAFQNYENPIADQPTKPRPHQPQTNPHLSLLTKPSLPPLNPPHLISHTTNPIQHFQKRLHGNPVHRSNSNKTIQPHSPPTTLLPKPP